MSDVITKPPSIHRWGEHAERLFTIDLLDGTTLENCAYVDWYRTYQGAPISLMVRVVSGSIIEVPWSAIRSAFAE